MPISDDVHPNPDAEPQDENLGHTGELAKPQGGADPQDGHLGAIETQVRQVPAPAGRAFTDEPKQG